MTTNSENSLKTRIENYSTDTNTKDVNIVDKKCAPAISYSGNSCYSLDILIKLAKNYNKHNSNKIELDKNLEMLYPKKYKKYLVDELTEKLKDRCSNQHCWLTLEYANDLVDNYNKKLTEKFFRPVGPQGKFTWLNTVNINQVMTQYQDLYKDFVFLGAVPMDFYDVSAYVYIKNLKAQELIDNNKTKVGIVYNLDNHNQPGSHWVAGYIDISIPAIYYYDSYASRPGKRVREFYEILKNDISKCTNKNVVLDYNRTRNQYGDSECGMFSLYFIIMLLKGIPFKQACKDMPNDEKINKLREELFILPEEIKPNNNKNSKITKNNKK